MSDPNREDEPDYILKLIRMVITVSMETVRIVKEIGGMRMGERFRLKLDFTCMKHTINVREQLLKLLIERGRGGHWFSDGELIYNLHDQGVRVDLQQMIDEARLLSKEGSVEFSPLSREGGIVGFTLRLSPQGRNKYIYKGGLDAF